MLPSFGFTQAPSSATTQHWTHGIVSQLKTVETLMEDQFKSLEARLRGVNYKIGDTQNRV